MQNSYISMRKLLTKEELEKKRKFRNSIISISLLLIMLFSTLGYSFLSNTSPQNEENDINSDKIAFQYGGKDFALLSSYDEIKNISVDISLIPEMYSGKILYIVSKNTGVAQEIAYSLGKLSSRVQMACYGACEEDLPEKNCTDNLIIWEESQESRVFQEDNCIFIEGDMRTVDAFIYSLFVKK